MTLASLKRKAKREGWAEYIRGPNDERAMLEGCYVDLERGLHFVEFCKRFIKLSKGKWAGRPWEPMQWQIDEIMVPLFGWRRPDNTRRFRRAGIWVPKKNAKSTLCGGILVYLLRTEPGNPELYIVANDRQQAGIVFGVSADMVRASPELKAAFKITSSTKNMRYGHSAWIRALSADFSSAEGLDAAAVVVDELHQFDERGRRLLAALEYSGRARQEPLQLVISTAGDDVTKVGYQEYQYAKAVADGTHTDTRFLSCIHEADNDDPWDSVDTFRKANPSAGIILQDDDFVAAVNEARGSPRKIADVKRYLLNVWVTSSKPWLDMALWDKCESGPTDEQLLDKECFAGIDAGSTRDLSALALVFPLDNGAVAVRTFYWCSEQPISDRARAEREGYADFVARDLVDTTSGDQMDTHAIREKLIALRENYYLREVGFDPWNMNYLAQDLQDKDGMSVIKVPQTCAHLNEACKTLEKLVEQGKLLHGGNPVLRWCASNATIKHDSNDNIRPAKPEPGSRQKIDGISAVVNALALMVRANRFGASVYDEQGITFI